MKRPESLSETEMQAAERQFPALAAAAGREAYERALRQHGRVVKAENGFLVEALANGTTRVIRELAPATPVERGRVLTRHSAR